MIPWSLIEDITSVEPIRDPCNHPTSICDEGLLRLRLCLFKRNFQSTATCKPGAGDCRSVDFIQSPSLTIHGLLIENKFSTQSN